MKVIELIF